MSLKYKIIFEGNIIDGFELHNVKSDLMSLLHTDQEQIDHIFRIKSTTIKKNIDHQTAIRIINKMKSIGAICRMSPMDSPFPALPHQEQPPRQSVPIPLPSPGSSQGPSLHGFKYAPSPPQRLNVGFFSIIIAAIAACLLFLHGHGVLNFAFLRLLLLSLVLFGIGLAIYGLCQAHGRKSLAILGMIINVCFLVWMRITLPFSNIALVKKYPMPLPKKTIMVPEIPITVDQKIQKDVNREMYAVLYRHTAHHYEKGKRLKWRQLKKYLENVCHMMADYDVDFTLDELVQEGEQLITRGYANSLARTWHGNMLLLSGRPAEGLELLKSSLRQMQQRQYSKINYFFVFRNMAYYLKKGDWTQDAEAKRYKSEALAALAYAALNDEFEEKEMYLVFRLLDETWESPFGDQRFQLFFDHLKFQSLMMPWLKKIIEAKIEINEAWNLRGSGYANTVTDEGWEGFRRHMQAASTLLHEAQTLNPTTPEAAAMMIEVAMCGYAHPGESEATWFVKSVSAQLDYYRAYRNFIHALRPQWGGSHESMYQLGLNGLKTNRFDTDLPLLYVHILRCIGAELPNYNWRSPFRRPEVAHTLDTLFNTIVDHPDRRDRNRLKAYAILAKGWSGFYDQASLDIKSIGEAIDFKKGYWGLGLSIKMRPRAIVETEYRLFTGPFKEQLRHAESLHVSGQIPEALKAFKHVMGQYTNDPDAFAYLRTRIGYIQLGVHSEQVEVGFTPLLMAAWLNNLEVARFLLENGADANGKNNYGSTPLSMATSRGHIKICELLLRFGADVNAKNRNDWTALHNALYKKYSSIAELLLKNGADVSPLNNNHWAPLHYALRYDQPEIAKTLIWSAADVNVKNDQEWTPLHLAVYYGHDEVVKILVEEGADRSARVPDGRTALQMARNRKNQKLIQILSF